MASSAASDSLSSRSARASGCCSGGVDRGARADHHAGLRAAEQLVAGETHERGAGPRPSAAPAARRRALRGPRRGCPSRRRRSPARRARTAPRSRPPARSRAGGSSTGARGGWRRCARSVRGVVGTARAVGGADLDAAGAGLARRRRGCGSRPRSRRAGRARPRSPCPGPASAAAASRTAAAQLLTASAASAPVSSVRRRSTWAWREPRVPRLGVPLEVRVALRRRARPRRAPLRRAARGRGWCGRSRRWR